ncbi:YqaJ viral recombinase family protein [Vibrio owensii]|uniref:YqaJ viral recombinase family protein n=1 Tax=Vibrio harveyi group TaxID=717610 RepID=UPI003CC515C8
MNYDGLIQFMRESAPYVQDSIIEDWVYSAVETISNDLDLYEDFPTAQHRTEKIEALVKWHIRRMNGFGGSDMSVLYTEYKGGFTTYGGEETIDAASVVAGKLALVNVTGTTGDMERGKKLEDEARVSFERQMNKNGYGLKPHALAYKKLKEFQKEGWKDHPWCFSSPDGIYIDKHGKTWLVDFKVPNNTDNVQTYYWNPPMHYRAQLAQYKAHLEAAGVKIDNVALVPFSTKEWKSYIAEFEVTETFMNEIMECGDYYWEFVKSGELPRRPPNQDFQFVDELSPQMKSLMSQFIMASKMKGIATKKQESLKSTLLEMASINGVDWKEDGRKTRLPGVDITHKEGKRKLNSDALKAKYEKLGGSLDDDELYTTTESTTVSVVRGKKVAFIDFIVDNQDIAESMFQDAVAEVKETQDFVQGGANDVYDPTEPDRVIEHQQQSAQVNDAAFDELGF